MNLIEAFQEMIKGGKVRRKNDDSKHFICFNENGELVDEEGKKKVMLITTVENVTLDAYTRQCDVLDKAEKNLLSLLINSKKSKALYVIKTIDDEGDATDNEKIIILFDSKEDKYVSMKFKRETMFRKLVLGDKYTPDELGL